MKLTLDSMKYRSDEDMNTILAHHDVVFRAPVQDPTYGIPIGNGDQGCLVWVEAERLHISLNKTDLWDSTYTPDEIYCTMEGENLTTCRHGAHMMIDFHCPVFEMLFQNRYEGRLSLYDASAQIHADTPFCKTDITAFSSEAAEVSVIHATAAFTEDMPISVTLQRWGSRTEWFWYNRYKAGAHYGLSGTNADCSDGIMRITQILNGTIFCVALLPVCETPMNIDTAGSHKVQCSYGKQSQHTLTLYVTVTTGNCEKEAVDKAILNIRNAAAEGYETLWKEHRKRWAQFWSKSYVSLPKKQDFLENLWYLNLYYAGSQMKGKSPAHFCNGIWNFYYDFVPWNHFFHYNMQLATFPLEAANHPELLETYYRFRVQQLPLAKKFAETYKHTGGAFYSDVCDAYGRQDRRENKNCTCGAQLAMMLYRHYRFSGDVTYLQEQVLPMMRETAQFYLDILTLGEDGYYHVLGTQGYEGSPLLDDSITDYAMIRALFGALIEVLPENETEVYRRYLQLLPPYRMTEMMKEETADGCFTHGIGKGCRIQDKKVLCVGRHHGTDQWLRKTFGNPEHDYYGFPDTEMAPLFPAGTVGIRERNSELYKCIYNSVCLHHPALVEGNVLQRDPAEGICMGWCMEPIYLARMGLSELLAKDLENTITTWITYPQGFGYYMGWDHEKYTSRGQYFQVQKENTDEIRHLPTGNFRHFDYETLPVIATALNEMLLQSYDGIVRLFCAVLPTEQYAFTLLAEGGFMVNAVYQETLFNSVITSTRGGTLLLAFENAAEGICFYDDTGKQMAVVRDQGVYTIETEPGMRTYVRNTESLVLKRDYLRNMDVKIFGDAKLGEYQAMD